MVLSPMLNNIDKKILKYIEKYYFEKKDSLDKIPISNIENIINYASDKYYNKQPIISDALYDALIDFLENKKPNSIILKKIGAQPNEKEKIKLKYWLGSMNKFKLETEINTWVKKYTQPYSISEKLDGVSALLIFEDNISLATRGDGSYGTNITELLKYINIGSNFSFNYDKILSYFSKLLKNQSITTVAFRGELILSKLKFNKWNNNFTNERAATSGLVNSKNINIELAKDIDLVIYEIIYPYFELSQQYEIIKNLNMNCVNYKIYQNNISIEDLNIFLEYLKKKSQYQIDGIVISSCNYKRNIKGNPDYAFAYKPLLSNEKNSKIATVKMVKWTISKDGYIKPTIIINPIIINGVTIKRTTGFNARYIVDNKIGSGSLVEIIRSGDVIPYIIKVIKISDTEKPDMPKSIKYVWNETKVDIISEDLSNSDINIKNLYHFFSSLKGKGLGIKTIEKIYLAGFTTIPKILKLTIDDLIKIETFKEKTAINITKSILEIIKKLSNIKLSHLISASNKLGRGFGIEKIDQLIKYYSNLIKLYESNTTKDLLNILIQVPHWNEKTAKQFIKMFPKFLTFYKQLSEVVDIKFINSDAKQSKDFFNKKFVFSGFRDSELENFIIINKGIVVNSMSKSVSFLIVKEKSYSETEKVKYAISNNIPIITKEDFYEYNFTD